MITCPKCGQSLPAWAQQCQFCGADTKAVPRPVAAKKADRGYQPAKWVWPVYYLLAGYYILDGAFTLLTGLGVITKGTSIAHIVFGSLTILLGVGLATRIEIARGIVNFLCGLAILSGIFGLAGSVIGGMILGPLAILFVILNLFRIFAAVMTIYLIGETERGMPNV